MLMFLSRDRVWDDHIRFSKSINDHYDVQKSEVFEADGKNGSSKRLGYKLQKDGNVYVAFRLYAENEQGELAIMPGDFFIENENGEILHEGLYSLGDVFSALAINKTN